MEIGKIIGKSIKYGLVVGIILGIINSILALAGLIQVIPFIGPILGLILLPFVAIAALIMLGLSAVVSLVVGWLVARAVGQPDIGSAVVSGSLAVLIMDIVAGTITVIANVLRPGIEIIVYSLVAIITGQATIEGALMGAIVAGLNAIIFGLLGLVVFWIPWIIFSCFAGIVLGAIGGAVYSITAKKPVVEKSQKKG